MKCYFNTFIDNNYIVYTVMNELLPVNLTNSLFIHIVSFVVGRVIGTLAIRFRSHGFELICFNVYSELLGHFPSKIRFVFRSLPHKRLIDAEKRSNVQDNSDVTKQVSSPFLPFKCAAILETFS